MFSSGEKPRYTGKITVSHILTLVPANEGQEVLNSDLNNNGHFTNLKGNAFRASM
jgi:hypothetical protein